MLRPRNVAFVSSLLLVACAERFDVESGVEDGDTVAQDATNGTTGSPADDTDLTTGTASEGTSSTAADTEQSGCEVREYGRFDGTAHLQIDGFAHVPVTFEAWVLLKQPHPDDGTEHVAVCQRGTTNDGWGVRIGSESLTMSAFSKFDHPAQVEMATGTWRHVAWVYDGESSRVFVDGRVVDERVQSGGIEETEARLVIGGCMSTSDVLHPSRGAIDEVRLSSTARYLSDFEPQDRFEDDENTLVLLHMDGEAKDSSSHGHVVADFGVIWETDEGDGTCR